MCCKSLLNPTVMSNPTVSVVLGNVLSLACIRGPIDRVGDCQCRECSFAGVHSWTDRQSASRRLEGRPASGRRPGSATPLRQPCLCSFEFRSAHLPVDGGGILPAGGKKSLGRQRLSAGL